MVNITRSIVCEQLLCVLWKKRRGGGSRRWGRAGSECIRVFSAHWVRAAPASKDWEEEDSEPGRHRGSGQAGRTAGTKYREEVPRYLRSSQEVGVCMEGEEDKGQEQEETGQHGNRNQITWDLGDPYETLGVVCCDQQLDRCWREGWHGLISA